MCAPHNAGALEPSIVVRHAIDSDVPALTRLINAAFVVEQVAFDGNRIDERGVRGYLGRGQFLLAENAGALVGCVHIERRGDHTYLGLLSVEPSRQGAGIGRRLVAAAEQLAASQGSRVMDLRVISPRAGQLLPFYERLGYRITAREPFPPELITKVPSHYIFMSKPLT